MPVRLVPLTAGEGPVVNVQRPVVLIGRHPDCDVRIDRPQVSRRHCCVAQAYDRLLIRDLGSRNGVRVNGRLVEESALRPGDEVAIAQLLYRIEAVGTPPPPPAFKEKAPTAAPPRQAAPKPASLPELPISNDPDSDLVPLDDLLEL